MQNALRPGVTIFIDANIFLYDLQGFHVGDSVQLSAFSRSF